MIILLALLVSASAWAQTLQKCKQVTEQGFDAMDEGDFSKALEYLTQAQLMAEKNHWYPELFMAKNNIGIIYFRLFDYGEALNYYLDSYSIAIKYLDSQKEMSVLNNIAVLYSVQKNYGKGEEYFKKAYDIAVRENNSEKIGHYAINLARVANKTGQLGASKKYLNEAFEYVKNKKQLLLQAKVTKGEFLLLSGRTQEAKKTVSHIISGNTQLPYF